MAEVSSDGDGVGKGLESKILEELDVCSMKLSDLLDLRA